MPRSSHARSRFGHTSSSISTSTVGRRASSVRATDAEKSSGARMTVTPGVSP